MPHAVFKLAPFTGAVNTTETPALNENSGISQTNLIRFQPDPPSYSALIQKLGGWLKWFPNVMQAIVRALWAWEDLNLNAWLALGTQQIPATTRSQLAVITGGVLTDITPLQAADSFTPVAATATIGSPSIAITDNIVTGVTNSCSVYIPIQIAVGGVVLFGLYQCDPDGYSGANSYTVYARTLLGALNPAINTDLAVLPELSTVSSSNVVTVALPFHGYSVGLTFPVLIATTVGGLTIFGNYVIQSIIDENTFTILASAPATATASAEVNNGNVIYVYNGLGAPTTPPAATPIETADWTMANFGQDLIVCPTTSTDLPQDIPYQPIYLWTPAQQPTAQVIPQAPPVNDGVFVAMPQRQIVTWGSTATGIQDPLLMNWCDVNNPYQWIALPTNQAGSNRIPTGSRIVSCVQGPQQALVWTDVDVWSMQYVGLPYVYSFNQIGTGCGLIGRKAAGFFNGIAYWMGFRQFYVSGGSGVEILPSTVWDVVFQNLYQGQTAWNKIRFFTNALFGEIGWYYPSANGTGEIDSYVKYNVNLGLWDYGSLGRSAWADQSVLGPPIGADPVSLYLYQHETSNDADGQPMLPFFQSGYFTIAEGDFKTFVDLVWPDMRWTTWNDLVSGPGATVQITFMCLDYPGDTPVVFGPYTVTQATKFFNTRLRARLVAIRISSSDLGTFWRIGALRYRYAPDAKF
jgi:hypothetical protein